MSYEVSAGSNGGNRDDDFLKRLELVLAGQNEKVLGKVAEVSKKVDDFADDLDSVKREVKSIKEEQPITRREAERVRRAVSRRVCELLEIPADKRKRTVADKVKYEKYSRKLFGVCYAEVSREGHLAKSSYLDTPRRDYDAALLDIGAFSPSCGMANFYNRCDEDALAKRIAKEQGYCS